MKSWLFLDDSNERHWGFYKLTKDLPVVVDHIHTADEAIAALRLFSPYDCVFLDHDLENTDPDCTGQTVAEYIALHLPKEKLPRSVVIHSHNPEGAKRMQATLAQAGVMAVLKPFKV